MVFEAEFPGIVPYRHQIGIITEVEELVPRSFGDFTLRLAGGSDDPGRRMNSVAVRPWSRTAFVCR